MDRIKQDENTKQKGGAVEHFSHGVMNRKELCLSGTLTALVPHAASLTKP